MVCFLVVVFIIYLCLYSSTLLPLLYVQTTSVSEEVLLYPIPQCSNYFIEPQTYTIPIFPINICAISIRYKYHLQLLEMEYTTIVVRWQTEPLAHHNFLSFNCQPRWYFSRWSYKRDPQDKQGMHLTVITFKCMIRQSMNAGKVFLERMKRNWCKRSCVVMQLAPLHKVIQAKPVEYPFNKYSIYHTELKKHRSFYDHVKSLELALKDSGWKHKNASTETDPITRFKIHCKHVSRPNDTCQQFPTGHTISSIYVSNASDVLVFPMTGTP